MEQTQVTDKSPFVFTPAEEAAIARILREFPEAAEVLEVGVRPMLAELVKACKGVIRSKEEADYVLAGLADRIVGRTITETDTWSEADELRTAVIDFLTRHLLRQVRAEFLRAVVERKHNSQGR